MSRYGRNRSVAPNLNQFPFAGCMLAIDPLGTVDDVAHGCGNQFRDLQFGFDGDFGGCNFGVFTFLAGIAGKLYLSITTARWRIISEHIKRVFAGMETAFASDDAALVLEALV